MRVFAAACALSLIALPVMAQSTGAKPQGAPIYRLATFNDLVKLCDTAPTSDDYESASALCHGYISGVLDDHRLSTAEGRVTTRVCMPHEAPITHATAGEMLTWARQNTRNGTEPAATGVIRYYAATYPCPS